MPRRFLLRAALGLTLLLPAAGFGCDRGRRDYAEPLITIKGWMTDDGVECPTMRDTYGQIYSLLGDTTGFRRGDRVCVKGRRVEDETCGVGITIKVEWIAPARSCS